MWKRVNLSPVVYFTTAAMYNCHSTWDDMANKTNRIIKNLFNIKCAVSRHKQKYTDLNSVKRFFLFTWYAGWLNDFNIFIIKTVTFSLNITIWLSMYYYSIAQTTHLNVKLICGLVNIRHMGVGLCIVIYMLINHIPGMCHIYSHTATLKTISYYFTVY